MVAVALATLAGMPAPMPVWLRETGFIATGALLGAGITPESLSALGLWPASLLALGLTLPLLLLIVGSYLRWVHGYDRLTALLCAMPGALSYAVAMAMETGADSRRVAVVQSVRLVTVVLLIPAAIALGLDVPLQGPEPPETQWPGMLWFLGIGGAAAAGYILGRLCRLPAPSFTGPMLASGALFATGTVSGPLPDPVLWPPLIICGVAIGARFAGSNRIFLAACAKAGLGGTAIALVLTGLAAWPTAIWLELPFIQIWLAFAPGGMEAMAVLAFALGVDPAFVVGHQLLRFVALSFMLPWLVGGLRLRRSRDPP
jgi:membrane AbrB-like protein